MKHHKLSIVWVATLLFFFSNIAHAQEIAGDWQGTLSSDQKLRIILQMEKGNDGALKGRLYSIDQSPDAVAATTLSFVGTTLKFTVDTFHVAYEGTLSADGKTITGNLTQGKPKPLVFERVTKETAWKIDVSPHKVQMIPVEKDIKLEVLDWGGVGRPLVLLSGLGDTAHVFDTFAPKLTANYHVYGITRRGFGTSSSPSPETASYAVDRLGEDVLGVIDALHLDRPIVAGHSLGGEELSYIGSHHPEKVAGLIYLDAGYPYALYDKMNGNMLIDSTEVREQLGQLLPGKIPTDAKKFLDDLLANLQRVEKEVAQQRQDLEVLPPPPTGPRPNAPPVIFAIMTGQQRFTTIKAPALVIFADPHDRGPMPKENPETRAGMEAIDKRIVERQAVAFETQVPSAHVVRIPHANHYVFRSNEADVLREMNAFIATLP
ncbi:MAG TPA: alpha/beta hydrolase [Edaphobacter sp.]|nr:alpha/beta hydrolase [Edaphobacter sp.]